MGPYKYKFGRIFRDMIDASRPFKNVLDVACADVKFRKFFGTTSYTGVDISRDRLSSDKAISNSKIFKSTDLIVADLANPKGLLVNQKFDLVVSTHTIKHISNIEDKKIASKNLINLISDDGYLIVQLNNDCIKIVKPVLDNNLRLVRHVAYKGKISRVMENSFSGKFHLSLFGHVLNLIFSYFDFGKKSDNLLMYKKIMNYNKFFS